MLRLTNEELNMCQRSLTNMYATFGLMPRIGDNAQNIAAIRYTIANWRPAYKSAKAISVNDYHILLCKLNALHPDQANAYIVVPTIPVPVFQTPMFKTLIGAYRNIVRRNGPGNWANPRFEHVLYMLHVAYDMTGDLRAYVMSRKDVRDLFTLFNAQQQAMQDSGETAQVNATSRSVAVQTALEGAPMADRKRLAREASGACYQCSAPKPRGVPCQICGYVPSTIRKSS